MKGLVIKTTGNRYIVLADKGTYVTCTLKGKFRMEGTRSTNPVVVGDHVLFEKPDSNQDGIIHEILPRKNHIVRKATKLSRQSHVLAANIDLAWIVVTPVVPKTSFGFIDRFLVCCEAFQVPVKIILNKSDLFEGETEEPALVYREIYTLAGYEVLQVSATRNSGLDLLKKEMKGKVNLFAGHSGVGKSTLINKICPEVAQKTAALSNTHLKGLHTTTFSEMFPLPEGGYVIDTPGIKEFGLFDYEKNELYHYFPEIFKVAANCRFNSCLHVSEPGCAVMEKVESGEISDTRYHSYLSILNGEELEKEFDD